MSGALDRLLGLQHSRDMADLGRHPGRGDDELAGTASDVGVHIHHVGPVPQRRTGSLDGPGRLGDGQALPGERRLRDLQRRRPQQPSVGRDDITGLDRDDIARHELRGGDLGQLAVPHDLGLDDHHLLQGGDGGSGLPLLTQAENRIEQRQEDQHDAGLPLLQRVEAPDTGHQQDDLHRIGVLADERPPPRLNLPSVETVRAKPPGTRYRLRRAETALPVYIFRLENLVSAQRVPYGSVGVRRQARGRRAGG